MSNLKKRNFTTVNGDTATPTLTLSDMGEVIFSASNDMDMYLPESIDGLWFRVLNTSNYNLNVVTSTPTVSTIVELTSHEDKLLMANGSTWYVFSSNYWKTGVFGNVTEGNYAEFENDGFLSFNGDGSAYNDIPPNPIIKAKLGGGGIPTLTTFVGNIEQYTFAVNDYVYDNFEFLHEYEEGTDFELHVHWSTNGTNTTDRYVKFEYEYSYANAGATPVYDQFSSSTVISAEVMIPANTPDRSHFVSRISIESGIEIEIGTVLTYRLRRITATGTAPTSNPFVLQAGCHIKTDTLGSRAMYSKT